MTVTNQFLCDFCHKGKQKHPLVLRIIHQRVLGSCADLFEQNSYLENPFLYFEKETPHTGKSAFFGKYSQRS